MIVLQLNHVKQFALPYAAVMELYSSSRQMVLWMKISLLIF